MDNRTRPYTLIDYVWFLGGFVAILGTIAALLSVDGMVR